MNLFNFLFWSIAGIRKKTGLRVSARQFSNKILKQYLKNLSGDIVNVSGWEDYDKEGNYYRNYYKSVNKYVITNIKGDHGMPENISAGIESIYLDLEIPISTELKKKFDIVFSHTVLEHVYDTRTALKNLADLSSDIVIIVVPFSQGVHYTESYGDYIRPTPLFLKRFFEDSGFSILLSCANEQPFDNIYLVFIASQKPEKHLEHFKEAPKNFNVQIHSVKSKRF